MWMARPTLIDLAHRQERFDVVILVAHGRRTAGQPVRLLLLRERDRGDCLSVEVDFHELGNFLRDVAARLAILVCCQERGGDLVASHELGQLLLMRVPNLDAVVSFNATLANDTAHGFLTGLAGELGAGRPFLLTSAAVSGLGRIPAHDGQNRPRFDFAVPTFHVRREVALQMASEAEFLLVSSPLRAVSFAHDKLAASLEALLEEWRESDHGKAHAENLARGELRAKELEAEAGRFLGQFLRFLNFADFPRDIDIAVGQYPVTRWEYAGFLRECGPLESEAFRPKDWKKEETFCRSSRQGWLPVTGVSLKAMQMYMTWRQQRDGANYRPLQFREWVQIAYWGRGELFPWGREWNPDRACAERSAPVAVYETWPNEVGIFGMAGNCWEVVAVKTNDKTQVTLFGGGFRSPRWQCTAFAYRDLGCIEVNTPLPDDVGFRLVRSPHKK